jgi:hypothetical protein
MVAQFQGTLRAIATNASRGKVNLPPSSIAGVEKAMVFDAAADRSERQHQHWLRTPTSA